jgi:hypothetical protein
MEWSLRCNSKRVSRQRMRVAEGTRGRGRAWGRESAEASTRLAPFDERRLSDQGGDDCGEGSGVSDVVVLSDESSRDSLKDKSDDSNHGEEVDVLVTVNEKELETALELADAGSVTSQINEPIELRVASPNEVRNKSTLVWSFLFSPVVSLYLTLMAFIHRTGSTHKISFRC